MSAVSEFWKNHGPAEQQMRLVEATIGRSVQATAPFVASGTSPFTIGGPIVGLLLIGGWVGVMAGLAAGSLLARVITRTRAPGMPCRTILAVSEGGLYAVKAHYFLGLPTALVGAWDLDGVKATVQRRLLTTAVELTLPDERCLRFETLLGGGKWAATLLQLVPAEAGDVR
jgi:hypothetical protein